MYHVVDILRGPEASRPAPLPTAERTVAERWYATTDSGFARIWRDTGTAWEVLAEANGVNSHVHTQSQAASEWNVSHGLGRYPVVAVIDSAGNVVYGDISHRSVNTLTVSFSAPFGGTLVCT